MNFDTPLSWSCVACSHEQSCSMSTLSQHARVCLQLLEQLALPRTAIALSDAFLAPFLQHAAALAARERSPDAAAAALRDTETPAASVREGATDALSHGGPSADGGAANGAAPAVPSDALADPAGILGDLVPAGHAIGTPALLFREIGREEAEALRARFAGTQADRASAAAAASAAPGAASATAPAAHAQAPQPGANPAVGSDAPAAPVKPVGKPAPGKGAAANGAAGGREHGKTPADGVSAPARGAGADGEQRAVDVSRLDLRVGLIRRAWEHPDADSLYVEEVDCGDPEPRQVSASSALPFSGCAVRNFVPKHALVAV